MKYNYPQLQEPCKSCLGCQRLEDLYFTGDKDCKWIKEPEFEQIKIEEKKVND